MSKVCDMDCFNCKYDDCIKDDVYPESQTYSHRNENYKKYQKEYKAKRYAELKLKGICVKCGKSKATHGVVCLDCYIRQKRNDTKRWGKRKLWKSLGKCYFCGEDVVPSKKVCAKHYNSCADNVKKATEASKKARKDKENET